MSSFTYVYNHQVNKDDHNHDDNIHTFQKDETFH